MTKQDIIEVKKILATRIPEVMKEHVLKVIMYGSCARGDFTDDSDIDIAIITDCDRLESKQFDDSLMDAVTDIAMMTDAIVEYICIPFAEYEEKKSWYGYFKNIEREGELIYG